MPPNVTRFQKFINDNIIMLVGIPLIIGIHLGWWKMQQNPNLVSSEDRKDVYKVLDDVKKKIQGSNPPGISTVPKS